MKHADGSNTAGVLLGVNMPTFEFSWSTPGMVTTNLIKLRSDYLSEYGDGWKIARVLLGNVVGRMISVHLFFSSSSLDVGVDADGGSSLGFGVSEPMAASFRICWPFCLVPLVTCLSHAR